MGRHKLVTDPQQLWDMFIDYKNETKSDPFIIVDYVGKDAIPVNRMKERALTMEGYEEYVACIDGMPWELRDYFANTDNRYSDFTTVCSRIRRAIRQDQIAGGLAGLYNPSITQRLNGLVDKQEVKTVKEQPLFTDDPINEETTPE